MPATETTAPATCTVVIDAGAHRCGAPAVYVLPGGKFAECADHAGPAIAPRSAEVSVGDRVRVDHIGVEKIGTVVAATATRVRVSVPVYAGTRRESVKIITRRVEDVEVAR